MIESKTNSVHLAFQSISTSVSVSDPPDRTVRCIEQGSVLVVAVIFVQLIRALDTVLVLFKEPICANDSSSELVHLVTRELQAKVWANLSCFADKWETCCIFMVMKAEKH